MCSLADLDPGWPHHERTFSILSLYMTAGLAFGDTCLCSYRARGVDGSCAKQLTVESYTVVYAANSLTYYY